MIRQKIKRMHHGRPLFKYHRVALVRKAPLLPQCWYHLQDLPVDGVTHTVRTGTPSIRKSRVLLSSCSQQPLHLPCRGADTKVLP